MAEAQNIPQARPAHTFGRTLVRYTPDGSKLVSVGSNSTARVYHKGIESEPVNVDDLQEGNQAIAVTNKYLISGSEDGTVSVHSLSNLNFERFLLRSTLPIRDIALSPDNVWCAITSDELTVKIVQLQDPSIIITIRDLTKPAKHVQWDPSSVYLNISGTDGYIYIYKVIGHSADLVTKLDGLVQALDTESPISSKALWHPSGKAFLVPTATRELQVVSIGDWGMQHVFSNGHYGDITNMAWSPNGALLASVGMDKKVLLWDSKTQTLIQRYSIPDVIDLAWHPNSNVLALTNSEGELFIYDDFVPQSYIPLLKLGLQPPPIIHGPPQPAIVQAPLKEISNNVNRNTINGVKDVPVRRGRRDSLDSLGELLGPEHLGYDDEYAGDEDDFIVDDDGAGYTLGRNTNGKRTNGHLDDYDGSNKRQQQVWTPSYHTAFQPGATPWRGNRKYLCLNLIGFAWTVDQETHHTVTVEFYDREFHRDFHFTDTFRYDKACLNETGTLFSSPANPDNDTPATIFYRPHETWTERKDWRTTLPPGEDITSIALSDSFITVTTSTNYVRVYTLFLTPYRVYRQKSSPTVTCAAWHNYILTMGNGPVGHDGTTTLLYTIENIARDIVHQSEDIVALTPGSSLQSVFFSSDGDPCIYDSTGVLLVLSHWRTVGQARWTPLLDTKLLSRLASGRKTETYWPVAVADGKFHCIILKGGDKHPYFPRPLLSEFAFQIPIGGDPTAAKKKRKEKDIDAMTTSDDEAHEEEIDENHALEEAYVRQSLLASLLSDLIASTTSSATTTHTRDLSILETEIDKTLLKMLAARCMEGEEWGMKALEYVELLGDESGRMVAAAEKIAERYGRGVLGERIREIGERRLGGEEGF